ncbi:IPT/TIG domain-containing protein [Flindersiella endophytica]
MTVSNATTVTAMRAIASPQVDDVVEVAGYKSSHDGGGGTFLFDTTHITAAKVSSATITGATYSPTGRGPIVVTAAGHRFVNGQAVLVEGVGGNTNANGAWLVAVDKNAPDVFTLLGSRGNAAYISGGTAKSVTVETSLSHGLAPGGRAIIERATGEGGFALNGTYLPIGTSSPKTFTVAAGPPGSYAKGGAVGDGGVSVASASTDGRWVRRRDGADLNVAWFGAVGDGRTDDTEHLVAAIRAARTCKTGVYLPGGDFVTTPEIRLETYAVTGLTDHGLSIRGEGSCEPVHGGTRITARRTGVRSILSIHSGQVTIKGMRFSCAGNTDHGLYLQGASRLHLDDVHVEHAVKDGYRAVATNDAGSNTINDNVYARALDADRCGTMYCSSQDLITARYGNLRAAELVEGTVSCQKDSTTITGSGTKFNSIPARPGDFVLIGATDDATTQRLEIASIDSDTQITVHKFLQPSMNLTAQPFAIGVGDGWSEEVHNDNNRTRMDTGKFTYCAGSGIVCRGMYGAMLDNMELQGCGFAGIVIGTLDSRVAVFLSTRISSPYFEGPFYGACIFLAQARGITIDQPMWFGQPVHRRLVYSEFLSLRAGVLGYIADFVDANHPTGLRPIGLATTDIPARRGKDFTNDGTLTLPSAGAEANITTSPWTTTIPIRRRNINIHVDRGTLEAPADVTATPTLPPGANGQEIALCNIGIHPVTFHDSRRPGPATGLVLDCEPGGTVTLGAGQIIVFYYTTANSMKDKWTQRGPIATSVPVLTSLAPNAADTTGGAAVTITGINLANASRVLVGATQATITANTSTTLTFTMPATGAGTHNVLVTTGRGASNILPIQTRNPA